MASRKMPSQRGVGASSALPPQQKSVGPSKKAKSVPAKSPVKSNLSARVKRTSDIPKPSTPGA